MTRSLEEIVLEGRVVPGHQVASGKAADSPFPAGTIEMQASYFLAGGLDLSPCYSGTLNVDIGSEVSFSSPDYLFSDIKWAEGFGKESFSFFRCRIFFSGKWVGGWIYYPHPDTKIGHFKKSSVLEVLAPFIQHIGYGDYVKIKALASQVQAGS